MSMRRTIHFQAVVSRGSLLAGFVALLVGCPGNTPQLDPRYESPGEGGCAPSRPGVCQRSYDGLHCAPSNGASAFEETTSWAPELDDASGWDGPASYETIRFPDVNGDGAADVCGRVSAGILCGLNDGARFTNLSLWLPHFSDDGGWANAPYYSTIHYADVNGDGKDDVCGRGGAGVHCALSNGTTFDTFRLWGESFSDAGGWLDPSQYSTILFPDVNGDGSADACGRHGTGVVCGLSTGGAFAPATLWSPTFSTALDWNLAPYYATLRFPDLNADGMADVCGRARDGVYCGLSSGGAFTATSRWLARFTDAEGWGQPASYLTMAFPDVDGDGRADVCSRGAEGVLCALNIAGAFGAAAVWSSAFSDINGWGAAPLYTLIRYADLDGDGSADVCGRDAAGVSCGLSNGAGFLVSAWTSDFTDAQGFGAPNSTATFSTPLLAPPAPCP
jgi:hypothetical protein